MADASSALAHWNAAIGHIDAAVTRVDGDWDEIGACASHCLVALSAWSPGSDVATRSVAVLLRALDAWCAHGCSTTAVGVALATAAVALCRSPHGGGMAEAVCFKLAEAAAAAAATTTLHEEAAIAVLAAFCHGVAGVLQRHPSAAVGCGGGIAEMASVTLRLSSRSAPSPAHVAATADAVAAAVSLIPSLAADFVATRNLTTASWCIAGCCTSYIAVASGASAALSSWKPPIACDIVAVTGVDALLSCDHTQADSVLHDALARSEDMHEVSSASCALLSGGGAAVVRWCVVPEADAHLTLWERARLVALMGASCATGLMGSTSEGDDCAAPLDAIVTAARALMDASTLSGPAARGRGSPGRTGAPAAGVSTRDVGAYASIGVFLLSAIAPTAVQCFRSCARGLGDDEPTCWAAFLELLWTPAQEAVSRAVTAAAAIGGASVSAGRTLVLGCLHVMAAVATHALDMHAHTEHGAVAVSSWVADACARLVGAMASRCTCAAGEDDRLSAGAIVSWLCGLDDLPPAPAAGTAAVTWECMPPLSRSGADQAAVAALVRWPSVTREVIRCAPAARERVPDGVEPVCACTRALLTNIRRWEEAAARGEAAGKPSMLQSTPMHPT